MTENIYFWELIRANIFESILESTGVFSKHFNKHSEPIKNVYSGVKKLSDLELNGEHKLIFEFPRKKEKDYKNKAKFLVTIPLKVLSCSRKNTHIMEKQ